MPNFKKHASTGAIIGGLAGLAITLINQNNKIKHGQQDRINWIEVLGYTAGGATIGTIGGILPDLLEPANHPHHRKFFHSVTATTAVGYGIYKAHKSDMSHESKTAITTIGVGYISHVLLDSETPMGIPAI
jgi:membrane-bound metal-dependent hydrolase YbcI (DUF457 family)